MAPGQMTYPVLDLIPGNNRTEKFRCFREDAFANLWKLAKVTLMSYSGIISLLDEKTLPEINYGDGYSPLIVTSVVGIKSAAVILAIADEMEEHLEWMLEKFVTW